MKINFFKNKDNFKKKNFGINPNFYWMIAVFVTVLIILASFIFGYFLFGTINQEAVLPTINDNGQETVNTDGIQKVLNYFSEREQTSNQILNSSVPVVDPSL